MSLIQRITQRGHAEASATLNSAKFRRQRGASAIEYVIIVAVIAVGIFAAATFTDIGGAMTTWVSDVVDAIGGNTGG